MAAALTSLLWILHRGQTSGAQARHLDGGAGPVPPPKQGREPLPCRWTASARMAQRVNASMIRQGLELAASRVDALPAWSKTGRCGPCRFYGPASCRPCPPTRHGGWPLECLPSIALTAFWTRKAAFFPAWAWQTSWPQEQQSSQLSQCRALQLLAATLTHPCHFLLGICGPTRWA